MNLSEILYERVGQAISRALREEMTPVVVAAGLDEQKAALIEWGHSSDGEWLVSPSRKATIDAQISPDCSADDVRALVTEIAQLFNGSRVSLQRNEVMATVNAWVEIGGVEVQVWGVVERQEVIA